MLYTQKIQHITQESSLSGSPPFFHANGMAKGTVRVIYSMLVSIPSPHDTKMYS